MQNLLLIAIAVVILVVVMNGKGKKKSFSKSVSKYLSGTNGLILLAVVILFMCMSNRVEGGPGDDKCEYVLDKDNHPVLDQDSAPKLLENLLTYCDVSSDDCKNPGIVTNCAKKCCDLVGRNEHKPLTPPSCTDTQDDFECMKATDEYCMKLGKQAPECAGGPCVSPTNSPGDCRARHYSSHSGPPNYYNCSTLDCITGLKK